MTRKALLSSLALASLAACGAPQQPAVHPEPGPAPAAQETPPAAAPAASEAQAAAEPAKPQAEAPKAIQPAVLVKDVGFSSPESVLYDAANDVYLVSNVNGPPGAADGNGFISKVSPEGKLLELEWIAGGKKGAKLDAPKGLAIQGDTLYVADITVVRQFELKTGKPKADIKLPGATFVNDVVASGDGKIWATDTGVKITDKPIPEPTKSDSVWVIENGKARSVAKGEELGQPNGIAVLDKAVWIASLTGGELYRVDDKGKKQEAQKMPKGYLDGLVAAGDTLLVTSWESNALYRGKPGGTFEVLVPDVKGPADLGFDTKRSRVLLPLFLDNEIAAYDVK
ncbi:uncharacterized protein SOCE26_056880 [Sorangium cellulosum]|uniref:SMP-30/Gluconolactonase/LRE-like region domain-containing protein n=1 Tax=Sorangium cellulosum TaxID=56 RepID=A0A2L0EY32_SORCE|nr:hypothetical protein [Sorangium cellulosum]AUX44224.1 uncharacterized protein SOCE26_056880 [Sorangium cellulosum]